RHAHHPPGAALHGLDVQDLGHRGLLAGAGSPRGRGGCHHARKPPPDVARNAAGIAPKDVAAAAQEPLARPLSLSLNRSTRPTPGPTVRWNSALLGAPGCGRVGATCL